MTTLCACDMSIDDLSKLQRFSGPPLKMCDAKLLAMQNCCVGCCGSAFALQLMSFVTICCVFGGQITQAVGHLSRLHITRVYGHMLVLHIMIMIRGSAEA